ncbi:unnamed protein product [Paramecium sonneborni]|uniref:Uncharacterized protein n=1 Tax=Paramecium sonneborni TaxID=65129 RepID=A0A8S1KY75_9CILI|nr:unnamed protein product [Paramecium sonneborni]
MAWQNSIPFTYIHQLFLDENRKRPQNSQYQLILKNLRIFIKGKTQRQLYPIDTNSYVNIKEQNIQLKKRWRQQLYYSKDQLDSIPKYVLNKQLYLYNQQFFFTQIFFEPPYIQQLFFRLYLTITQKFKQKYYCICCDLKFALPQYSGYYCTIFYIQSVEIFGLKIIKYIFINFTLTFQIQPIYQILNKLINTKIMMKDYLKVHPLHNKLANILLKQKIRPYREQFSHFTSNQIMNFILYFQC